MQERGVARLWEVARFDFRLNAEAANYVDPKYYVNPRAIVSVRVRVGDVWVGVVWACRPVLIFAWL